LLIYVRWNIKLNKTIQKKKVIKLTNGFRKPDADLNLLTGYYSRQQPSSLWLGDVIFLGMECVGIKRFYVFLEDDSTDLREIFFQGLGGNTWSLQPKLKSSALGL